MSKIFDHKRAKAKQINGTQGCDEDYLVRDMSMKVGSCTRGGLKTLNEDTAKVTQLILNIDKKSKKEKLIKKTIENRGRTDSAF